MSELAFCIICGDVPHSSKVNIYLHDTKVKCWMVECTKDHEENSPFKYCEHRLTVYGENQEEAESRWNSINRRY